MGDVRVYQGELVVAREPDPAAQVYREALVVARDYVEPDAQVYHEGLVVAREYVNRDARIGQFQVVVCRPSLSQPDAYAAAPTFKSLVKKGNRQPVTLLSILSAGAAAFAYTTQADWLAASLNGLDPYVRPGSVLNVTGSYADSTTQHGETYAFFPQKLEGVFQFKQIVKDHWTQGVRIYATLTYGATTIISTNHYYAADGNKWGMGWYSSATWFGGAASFTFKDALEVPAGEVATLGFFLTNSSGGVYTWEWEAQWSAAPLVVLVPKTTGFITAAIDTGSVPDNGYLFSVDDVNAIGASIVYSYEGSDDGSNWSSYGSVSDGDPMEAHRYYRITGQLTAASPFVSEVKEIRLSEGEFLYFSTHQDQPVPARALVKKVSSLTSKIQLERGGWPTTGEISADLVWTKASGDLIAAGTLKNKRSSVKLGFVGLALEEYQDFHTGTFYDWGASIRNRTITVKLRDVLKQFEKVKIPFETVDGSGTKTTTPITWSGANPIQVMLDIFDNMGLQSGWINLDWFEFLRDGSFFGPEWLVTRTLSEPTSVNDLLSELSIITGVFLIPTPDGRITPVMYEPYNPAVATFDATVHDFNDLDGNQKELFTRQAVYYNANTADPSEEADYDSAYMLISAAQEIARGGEVSVKTYLDKWGITATAAYLIAKRWSEWYVDPLISCKVSNVSCYYIDVLPGQIVAVDNLELPVTAANWGAKTSGKKFLVTSRSVDPSKAMMSFDLRALDTALPTL